MKVIFFVGLMYVICYVAGFLLTRPGRGTTQWAGMFRAHIGYAYFLVSFYLFYVLLKSAPAATWAAVLSPGLFFCIRWGLRKGLYGMSIPAGKDRSQARLPLAVVMVAVVALAGWPYVSTGWGNYWHNGNYDIEDGLNGRDAYLEHKIFDKKTFSLEAVTGDRSWVDFSKKAGVIAPRVHEKDSYYAWYAGDGFRLQYSNLAFWSALFDERFGMDVAIVHAIFNLMLTAAGIFAFARLVFQLGNGLSAVAAFSSVAASFYLGTFWAGHIGSLMYVSLVPMLVTVLLMSEGYGQWRTAAPWVLLVATALAFTYPQALMLGLAYWLGYRVYASAPAVLSVSQAWTRLVRSSGRRVLVGLIAVLVVGLLLYVLWSLTEVYRIRQEGQYRAWGLVHDWGIIPLFLGYLPSTSGLAVRETYLSLVLIGGFSALAALVGLLAYSGKQAKFVRFFVFTWLSGLAFFYLFIRDSYYIYKYLYMHQFIIVVAVCAVAAASRRKFIRVACGGLLAINIATDAAAAWQIFHMPYNGERGEYERLAALDRLILSKTFVDLTGGEGIAVRQTFKQHAIETEVDPRFAEYFLVRRGNVGDITGEQLGDVVLNTELFDVRRSPEKNYLMVRTWFEPEVYPADPLLGAIPFRWVGQGKNDNVGIYVVRPDHASDAAFPFLRICTQPGPSAVMPITLNLTTGDGKKIADLPLNGTGCAWLPAAQLKDMTQPLILRTGAEGVKLHPPEDRILLYRLFSVAWTGRRYDEKALTLLNPVNDIVREDGTESVRFGNGWWPPENFNGEYFRWASDGAEILVAGRCGNGSEISMNLEIGPSHGNAPNTVRIFDEAGAVVSDTKLPVGRQKIEFFAPHAGAYRILTDSEQKPLRGEYRILDFRVLSIETAGC